MGIRYRRSVKLIPGLRLNAGLRGLSLTVGPRGASVSLGGRGVYGNLGIPGTGLSTRTRLTATPSMRRREAEREHTRQMNDVLRQENALKAAQTNDKIEGVLNIHLKTPAPGSVRFIPEMFPEHRPDAPLPKSAGFLGRLWKPHARRMAAANEAAKAQYERASTEWQGRAEAYEAAQQERRRLVEELRFSDPVVMEEFLEERLSYVDWPRETSVSFDLVEAERKLLMDVDLPEIEDMPTQAASVSATGKSLRVKDLSDTQSRKNYMRHVHGLGVRILGEAFASLPTVDLIVLSAYSQRPDRATGKIEDQYLYSVKVSREKWNCVSFKNLADLDPVLCLGSFDIRRKMTAAGTFTAVQPFET
jgi:hypothetical protein